MSIESVVPSNHLILYHPLLILPSVFPSIRVFSSESTLCIRWPKYWHFSISPSNEYSGLISFRIDWFDLLAVQGTLKNLLQHHKLKTSVLQCSAFFMVQLLHQYMTTGKLFNVRKSRVSFKSLHSQMKQWNPEVCASFTCIVATPQSKFPVFSAKVPWSTGISSLVPS